MEVLSAMNFAVIWVLTIGLPSLLCVSVGDDCEVSRQRRCKQALVAEMDTVSAEGRTRTNAKQMEIRCRRLEENLNCLVLQVAKCPTPNRSGDLIERVSKYMEDNCDAFGGWWSYDCFHLEDMKKCEKIFAIRDSQTSEASCRDYDRFRHCIRDVVEKQCSPADEHSLGNYLLDSAGDLVWRCPPSAPRLPAAANEGFVSAFSAPVGVVPAAVGVAGEGRSPRRMSGGIAVEESHLRNVYSSALTGESPFVTGCNARATEEMRGCLDRHQYERDQALASREEEDRLRKECCATWNYRRCLQNSVRIHCYDTRQVDIQPAVDAAVPHDRGFLCRNHWIYSCNGAHTQAIPHLLMAVAVVIATRTVLSRYLL